MITGEGETRNIVVERQLMAPATKVWRALTEPHLIEDWLMRNDFLPVKGHAFSLRKEPAPGVAVVIDCKVVEVDSNRTLSYTWSAYGTETIVTFTLTPTQDGTLLRVEQAGFPAENKSAIKGANAAWPAFLDDLSKLLGTLA